MDWSAAVLVLLGGTWIGAFVTGKLTASHERSERFRDRQFEAAGGFVNEYEKTLDVMLDLWNSAADVVTAAQRLRDAPKPGPGEGDTVGPEVLAEVHKAMTVGLDLVGRKVTSEHGAEDIARSRAVIERAIENLLGQKEPFSKTYRGVLRALQEMSDTFAQFGEAYGGTMPALVRLQVRVAQLNLLFAGADVEVVEGARQVNEQLVSIGDRVAKLVEAGLTGTGTDPEEEDDEITDDFQDANQLLADFAALANERVRPRPFRWRSLVGIGG